MKTMLPLLLVLFATTPLLHAQQWRSLTGYGDKLTVRSGETALVLSVSGPSYVIVRSSTADYLGVRLHPRVAGYRDRLPVNHCRHAEDRLEVDWQHPFAIAGPCTIELRATTVLTVKMLGAEVDQGR